MSVKGKTFIHEMPLVVTPQQNRFLIKVLNAGRMHYNALLAEALKRLRLIRQSKKFQFAMKIQEKSKRNKILKDINKEYGLTDYSLHKYAKELRNSCFIKNKIDSVVAQTLSTRAFLAVQSYTFKNKGKPRFKSFNRLNSIEGKSNVASITFNGKCVKYIKNNFPVIYDTKDKYGVELHALSCITKYCRIIRRVFKDQSKWFVQLIQEGNTFEKEKNKSSNNTVGIDIGPSTVAVVSNNNAFLTEFCSGIVELSEQKRILLRKLDRSRRRTNPQNYNSDGTVKKGIKLVWQKSNRYKKIQISLSDTERRLKAARNTYHGKLTNDIVRLGNKIHLEKLSYKSFQQMWGKSVKMHAPGMFVSKLKSKAERAGGSVIEISPQKTALSQICHNCGRKTKKPLSQRYHKCECGIGPVQRDLYSAFLSMFVEKDQLDISQASNAWASAEQLLVHAVSRLDQVAKGKNRLACFGLNQIKRQSDSHVKGKSVVSKTLDDVKSENSDLRAKEMTHSSC